MKLKKIATVVVALLLCSTSVTAQTLDRIRAVANDDVVTQRELDARVEQIKQQYQSNPQVLPSDSELRRQILDQLILESLQLQIADRGNLVLPEEQVDLALERIAANQGLSLNAFTNALRQQGQNLSQVREQIRKELTINEVQRQMVGRQIIITDSEVERYLTSQTGQQLQNTQYQLAYLRLEPTQKALAEQTIDAINVSGSALLDEANARDLGLRPLNEVPSLFRTITPVMKEQEAILIDNPDALHLIQLIDRTEAQSVNIQEYSIRHILLSLDALLTEEAARSTLTDLKQQIEAGADMATLANQFTDDTGSKGNGGSLGWSTLDVFVPEFAEAARNTLVGELSDIIKTQFGLHILRVEDVRSRDVGIDVLKNQIRRQLQQQRYQEAVQRWQTELLAESFIEIRP